MSEPAKLTKNQAIVMAALRRADRPLSAYQILDIDSVRDKGLKAPLTIYRALDKLIEHGLVHRIERLNAFVVCDHEPHAEPPAFMLCNACKRSIEFPITSFKRDLAREAAAQGFAIDHIQIELSGLCRDCNRAATAPSLD